MAKRKRLLEFVLCRRLGYSKQGFTLLELVVVLSVGSLIFIVLGSALVDYLYQSRSLLRSQKLREEVNRAAYLIQAEASEASMAVLSEADNESDFPSTCLDFDKIHFSLEIPKDTGVYGEASNISRVYYYSEDSKLMRCGPISGRDGILNHESVSTPSVVSAGMNLALETCEGEQSDSRQIAYKLSFPGISSFSPVCTVAKTRSLFICNPVATNELGSCPM